VTLQGIVVAKTDKISSKAGLNKTVMNMTDLPNGAFLLRVVCGNNRQTSKVIVNH
jgi:hypothetical protein